MAPKDLLIVCCMENLTPFYLIFCFCFFLLLVGYCFDLQTIHNDDETDFPMFQSNGIRKSVYKFHENRIKIVGKIENF